MDGGLVETGQGVRPGARRKKLLGEGLRDVPMRPLSPRPMIGPAA